MIPKAAFKGTEGGEKVASLSTSGILEAGSGVPVYDANPATFHRMAPG
jgi:hypothetical protein